MTHSALTLAEKARENRLRNAASRRGFVLERCRRRDPYAIDFGTYRVLDASTRIVVAHGPTPYGLSLEQVENALANGLRRVAL